MDVSKNPLAKIQSNELRQEAMSMNHTRQTIIVEVDLPLPTIEITHRSNLTEGRRVIGVSGGGSSETKVQQIREALERILGHQTDTYLSSSRSFVLEANGLEMRKIAEMQSVLAIWPNTRRQRYGR